MPMKVKFESHIFLKSLGKNNTCNTPLINIRIPQIKKNILNLFFIKYFFPSEKPIKKLKNKNIVEKNGTEAKKKIER